MSKNILWCANYRRIRKWHQAKVIWISYADMELPYGGAKKKKK